MATFSIAPVLGADECHELLKICLADSEFPANLQPNDLKHWLRLYSSRARVADTLVAIFEKKFFVALQGSRTEWAEFLIGDNHQVGPIDFLDDKLWRNAFETHEMRFFFRVHMPCFLLYGRPPSDLLGTVVKTSDECWQNIEKLVALDPLVIGHRRIQRLLNNGSSQQRREHAAFLGECMGKSAPLPTKRQVKTILAALTSRLSEMLGNRFTEPEIRGLYDAIARDRGLGLRDPDLPESSEAFAKGIQRYRAFWYLPSGADRDTAEAVRALEAMLL